MTGRTLIRGFRRLGIALAIPCFLTAAGFVSVAAYEDYKWREFPESPANWGSVPLEPTAQDPKKYRFEPNPFADLIPKRSALADSAPIAAGAAALGLALFLGAWLIGWVFAGFVRD